MHRRLGRDHLGTNMHPAGPRLRHAEDHRTRPAGQPARSRPFMREAPDAVRTATAPPSPSHRRSPFRPAAGTGKVVPGATSADV
jgi:hypothetical protein